MEDAPIPPQAKLTASPYCLHCCCLHLVFASVEYTWRFILRSENLYSDQSLVQIFAFIINEVQRDQVTFLRSQSWWVQAVASSLSPDFQFSALPTVLFCWVIKCRCIFFFLSNCFWNAFSCFTNSQKSINNDSWLLVSCLGQPLLFCPLLLLI